MEPATKRRKLVESVQGYFENWPSFDAFPEEIKKEILERQAFRFFADELNLFFGDFDKTKRFLEIIRKHNAIIAGDLLHFAWHGNDRDRRWAEFPPDTIDIHFSVSSSVPKTIEKKASDMKLSLYEDADRDKIARTFCIHPIVLDMASSASSDLAFLFDLVAFVCDMNLENTDDIDLYKDSDKITEYEDQIYQIISQLNSSMTSKSSPNDLVGHYIVRHKDYYNRGKQIRFWIWREVEHFKTKNLNIKSIEDILDHRLEFEQYKWLFYGRENDAASIRLRIPEAMTFGVTVGLLHRKVLWVNSWILKGKDKSEQECQKCDLRNNLFGFKMRHLKCPQPDIVTTMIFANFGPMDYKHDRAEYVAARRGYVWYYLFYHHRDMHSMQPIEMFHRHHHIIRVSLDVAVMRLCELFEPRVLSHFISKIWRGFCQSTEPTTIETLSLSEKLRECLRMLLLKQLDTMVDIHSGESIGKCYISLYRFEQPFQSLVINLRGQSDVVLLINHFGDNCGQITQTLVGHMSPNISNKYASFLYRRDLLETIDDGTIVLSHYIGDKVSNRQFQRSRSIENLSSHFTYTSRNELWMYWTIDEDLRYFNVHNLLRGEPKTEVPTTTNVQ